MQHYVPSCTQACTDNQDYMQSHRDVQCHMMPVKRTKIFNKQTVSFIFKKNSWKWFLQLCARESDKIKLWWGWSFHDCINKHLCSFGRHLLRVALAWREKKCWNMTRLARRWPESDPVANSQLAWHTMYSLGEKGKDALKLVQEPACCVYFVGYGSRPI